MTVQQFAALALVLVVIAWGGAAAVSYGVVEFVAEGAQGEQGERGPPGEAGAAGKQGPPGPVGPAENDDAVERLATLWSVQQASSLQGGIPVGLKDQVVLDCVQWVLTGEPDVGACPGFSAGE
jgi:hypothetical protein